MNYGRNVQKALAYSVFLHFQLWVPIWVIYLREDLGFSFTQITALDALYFLAQVVFEVPTGAIADRFGRRTSLILGSVILAFAVLVFGLARSAEVVFASYLLWALAAALQSGADSALLYDSLRLEGRESEFTRIQGRILAIAPAAALMGGFLGAPLAAATSLSVPILLSAVIAGCSVVVAWSFHEPPVDRRSVSYLATARDGLSLVRKIPGVRNAILFGALCESVAIFGVLSQPYLVDHGAAIGSLGFLLAPLRIASVVGALITYRLVRRLGEGSTFILAPLLTCLALFGVAAWDSLYAFAFFPVMALAASIRNPILTNYISSRVPSGQRATVLSVKNLVVALFAAVVEPLVGRVADVSSYQVVFMLLAIFTAVTVGPLLFYWRRSEQLSVHSL